MGSFYDGTDFPNIPVGESTLPSSTFICRNLASFDVFDRKISLLWIFSDVLPFDALGNIIAIDPKHCRC